MSTSGAGVATVTVGAIWERNAAASGPARAASAAAPSIPAAPALAFQFPILLLVLVSGVPTRV
jgi:hypothetical protein